MWLGGGALGWGKHTDLVEQQLQAQWTLPHLPSKPLTQAGQPQLLFPSLYLLHFTTADEMTGVSSCAKGVGIENGVCQ